MKQRMRHIAITILMCSITSSQTPGEDVPLVVAHRGASWDAPENTLAAFGLAWKLGAKAIEGDFHLTSDGHVVCVHDESTQRVSGIDLTVASTTLQELRKLDVGLWKDAKFGGERIPTLSQVLEQAPPGGIIYIELKGGPQIIPALRQALEQSKQRPEEIKVIAFDEEVVREAKRVLLAYETYLLISFKETADAGTWSPCSEQVVEIATRVTADGVGLQGNSDIVDEAFLARCRAAGLSTHVWTIDDPMLARRFARFGVASVTTNRPEFIRRALE